MKLSVLLMVTALVLFLAGCSSNEENTLPSTEYEDAVAKTPRYNCPSGYVLRCESKRVGRIRFSSIGKDQIESCSCETHSVPTQSPLPGIY